jgi:hypothetical protein
MAFRPEEPPYNPATSHSCNKALLVQEMLSMSRASDWDEARLEWSFYDAYDETNFTHCLCGHGIKERCVLHNRFTNCFALVGSSCVKEFMHEICQKVPMDAIHASIKRVRKNPGKAVHEHLVKLAREKRRITDRAYGWYCGCIRKRSLTKPENFYRTILNRRILGDPTEAADAERFCMPYMGHWNLDDQLLRQALEQGRLTEWEVKFYEGNYGKGVSAKQAPIKRRIEELTLPEPPEQRDFATGGGRVYNFLLGARTPFLWTNQAKGPCPWQEVEQRLWRAEQRANRGCVSEASRRDLRD